MTEEIETNPKALKFQGGDRVRITKYKNIFRKGDTNIWSREIFAIDSVTKTNPWTFIIKKLIRGKIIGSFSEKALLSKL